HSFGIIQTCPSCNSFFFLPQDTPKAKDLLENLNPMTKIIDGDKTFMRVVNDNIVGSTATSVWPHQFKEGETTTSVTLWVSEDVILGDLQVHCLQNYRISNSSIAAAPPHIIVETGT